MDNPTRQKLEGRTRYSAGDQGYLRGGMAFRMSVRERLLTAYKLLSMDSAAEYLGMSASNIFSEITNKPTNGS